MNTKDNIGVNRNVKDSLFRRLFGQDKKNALSLYNALNNSQYENEEDLYFTTLEDVVFMKMKNDVSFLLHTSLNLYEHQSTYNPNMPLRGFLYFADLYRQLIDDKEKLYSRKLYKIPYPNYIVFYNGDESDADTEIRKLRLSDAFYIRDELETEKFEQSDFEWTAIMLNINYGKNKEIMGKCKVLCEYSIFISIVKEYNKSMDTECAIISAVESCIKENILKDFFSKHRREVIDVCLTEFNEERYREIIREDAREEGLEEGRAEKGMKIFWNLLDKGFSVEEAQATVELTDEEVKVALEIRESEYKKS